MPWGSGAGPCAPPITYQCDPQVEKLVRAHPPPAVVVDLGAGGRRLASHVQAVDFVALPGTDIVCDVCTTPYDDASVDLVIATGLLEHVEDDGALMREIRRILKTGGMVHIEIPFLQQYHADPIDCRRMTLPGLRGYLTRRGFEVVGSGVHIGPTVTMITLLAYYVGMVFEGPTLLHRVVSHGSFVLVSAVLSPVRYLDSWLLGRKSFHRLAFGVYATARKV